MNETEKLEAEIKAKADAEAKAKAKAEAEEKKAAAVRNAKAPYGDERLKDKGVYLAAEGATTKVFHHPIYGPIKVKK